MKSNNKQQRNGHAKFKDKFFEKHPQIKKMNQAASERIEKLRARIRAISPTLDALMLPILIIIAAFFLPQLFVRACCRMGSGFASGTVGVVYGVHVYNENVQNIEREQREEELRAENEQKSQVVKEQAALLGAKNRVIAELTETVKLWHQDNNQPKDESKGYGFGLFARRNPKGRAPIEQDDFFDEAAPVAAGRR